MGGWVALSLFRRECALLSWGFPGRNITPTNAQEACMVLASATQMDFVFNKSFVNLPM